MISPARTVSIIIPTHDRPASLERALRALSAQSYPLSAVETIVVADGGKDGMGEIGQQEWPFVLRMLEQPALGPAAARNRGASASTGELLIFLDDDIEPFAGFVAAHVRAHAGEVARVAIGYLPPQLQGRCDFFAIMLRAWWESMFERMREPGHRFAYNDLLSGNFSIERQLFAAVGGFDESLRCHEDYELGVRLIAAGARLQFVPDAAGWHHEHTTLARALGRKRDEGQADAALARKHPDLAAALPLCAPDDHLTLRGKVLKRFALAWPAAGDRVEAICRSALSLLEGARLRTRWRRLLDDLLSYWYWRGVRDSLDGASLETMRREASEIDPEALEIDLQRGLETAMQQLNAAPATAIRLRWGSIDVGSAGPQPGAELLEGRHLRGLLRTRLARPLAKAIELSESLAGEGGAHYDTGARAQAEKRPA
jgi:GT2 family glycosyltransferase